MKTYLIYFHEENREHERIVKCIKKFEHHSMVSHNVWLIRSVMNVVSIRNIFNNLSNGKPLFVLDISTGNWASISVNNDSIRFLKHRCIIK